MEAVRIVAVFCLMALVAADTPANCSYEDVKGKWVFSIGEGGFDRTLNCSSFVSGKTELKLELLFPDLAVDQYGNKGFWTLIYNQGFEVTISGRKFFAFSKYEKSGGTVESICDHTFPGWSHDILDRNWACFSGSKEQAVKPKFEKNKQGFLGLSGWKYRANTSFIDEINHHQKSWRAVQYEEFEGMDLEDMIKMAGGRKSRVPNIPKPKPATHDEIRAAQNLPESFDWRNVDGMNYVSPIRNQEACGSCFAFASMAMHEARIRIMTNNTLTPVFSPQDVVECSEYSQGCEGGFPYLIGGKYAEDFGIVQEICNPYKGTDGPCSTLPNCPRQYGTKYEYIGGFYGACNEELMKINLVNNGPLAVGFEVYNDFMHYKGGVYHHTFIEDKFNPFELTNHAVLLVGYGTDPQAGDYWIVKNSWGTGWGENGFFRIRRGNDECAIESMAVQSFPILQ